MPLNMISVMRYPRISFAFSNNSLAKAEFSYRSLPIPTNWAPWPGNTNAFIFLIIWLVKNKLLFLKNAAKVGLFLITTTQNRSFCAMVSFSSIYKSLVAFVYVEAACCER